MEDTRSSSVVIEEDDMAEILSDGPDTEAPAEDVAVPALTEEQKAEFAKQQEAIDKVEEARTIAFKSFGTFFLVTFENPMSLNFKVLVSGTTGEAPPPNTDIIIAAMENILRRLKFQEEVAYQQHMMEEQMRIEQARQAAEAAKPKLTVPVLVAR